MIFWVLFRVFALTLLVEMPVAFFVWGKRGLYPVFLGNLLTNPLLNILLIFCVSLWGLAAYTPALVVLEVAAVVAEGEVIGALLGEKRLRALEHPTTTHPSCEHERSCRQTPQ